MLVGLSDLNSHGLVHKDLKPQNIMFDAKGNVKIIDFGLCSEVGEVKSKVIGTPGYCPPELFTMEGIKFEYDIFSLGCMFYKM